ncbi:cell division protein FtsQ/DivIB [Brevibacillus borstelensis]|jgi:cell division protein FtsQ|uniref:Cell division protein DivIB n=1 Tax=Brevibacillus borstelensis AK1 TaxID=1300222 RepID=M8E5C6_9BACL|nr:FtsQ-type POTRA domain-containing protein [Brevibacillus borstelensis]EMT54491.1 division initiation protein [Brevibacillus borstelensis AK1]MCC0563290.1 FtsQ-type POTRA domain-containing protein [Brevibacillus borstelensis]MCM3471237.1 FtsQ-type POTRA domain-containing protein [Brevibacillus borstelensis]MCM3557712.1 FtsQ-type POTRA domain-containing protein [Brevibacillus borstelensis]MCM3589948.1 FtsQ-type POTRA domain-containing protein [Brevibacillus borstelensis]
MAVIEERIPHVKEQRPRRKGNRKLVVLLVLFFLIVLIVLFIRSPYSKVQEIQVYGNDMYTSEEIIAHSGLTLGMQFLNVWESQVQKASKPLEGVKTISVERSFPGVIRLHVTEFKRVAFWNGQDGSRAPLLENGKVLRQVDFSKRMVDRPLISSWPNPEMLPDLAKALAKLSPAVLGEISDIALTPTIYDNQRVTLFMRDGNEVRSVVYKLDTMLNWYPTIVQELPKGVKGVLSLFEQPWFVPYSNPGAPIQLPAGG